MPVVKKLRSVNGFFDRHAVLFMVLAVPAYYESLPAQADLVFVLEESVNKGSKKVRVAIVGVGNCASSLVQGIEFYRTADENAFVPGLMHVNLGGYHVGDVEFSAAFDVVESKVGRDLSEAIAAEPNNTIKFAEVPHLGVTVLRGPTLDGLGKYVSTVVGESQAEVADVVRVLRESKTDVVVNYLPVGSEQATQFYATAALEAGVGFVNCIPVFIASNPE